MADFQIFNERKNLNLAITLFITETLMDTFYKTIFIKSTKVFYLEFVKITAENRCRSSYNKAKSI